MTNDLIEHSDTFNKDKAVPLPTECSDTLSAPDLGEQPSAPMGRWKPNEEAYIGTKIIRAMPMSETDFLIKHKGKTAEQLRQQETYGDGYKVTYEDGYVSWSPKRVFEQCYRRISHNERDIL